VPRKNAAPGAPELRLIPGGAGSADEPDVLPTPSLSIDDLDIGLLVGSIYQDLAGQVRQATGALEAELVVSGWLGVMTATITVGTTDADDATYAFLTRLIHHAHRQGTAEALATLRVLAVLAPSEVAAHAHRAAWSLVEIGLVDRSWTGSLGVPMIGRCWSYGDPAGDQVSVNLTFEYGSGDHLLSVLVDHHLGGGIKDCWLGDAPALAWQRIRELADGDPGVVVEEQPWPEARDFVLTALTRPECPVDDDQVQDLAEFMPIVRARMAHLGGRTGVGHWSITRAGR
jgi:hypothetical protein